MKKICKIDPRVPIKDGCDITPYVITVNKFNEGSARKFNLDMEKANQTGQPFIPIVIDSYGGEVYSLLGMIEQIQTSLIPVVTIVESKAISCGAILFCMGQERYMSKHSTLMFHEVSNVSWGKSHEIETNSKHTSALNKKIFELASKNIAQPNNFIYDLVHKNANSDLYLTSTEAKKHNICTMIQVPYIYTEVTINHTLVVNK
jgi:ATP-dependent protease ClpP protease subunit